MTERDRNPAILATAARPGGADRNASLLAAADAIMRDYFGGWWDITRIHTPVGEKPASALRDAIYDALASASASDAGQRPKVKPLKWRPKRLSAREETDWYADSPVGQYAVGIVSGKPTAILRSLAGDDGVADKRLPGKPATIEAAKAAAQADYEARILSALDVPEPAPAWRDIATAPKDGTRILLARRGGKVVAGRWDEDRYRQKPRPFWTDDEERIWGRDALRRDTPSGWMPLPTPPPADGGSDG